MRVYDACRYQDSAFITRNTRPKLVEEDSRSESHFQPLRLPWLLQQSQYSVFDDRSHSGERIADKQEEQGGERSHLHTQEWPAGYNRNKTQPLKLH